MELKKAGKADTLDKGTYCLLSADCYVSGPILGPSERYSALLQPVASDPPHNIAVAQSGLCGRSRHFLMSAGPCHNLLPALSCDKRSRVTQANQTQNKWVGDLSPSEHTPEFNKVERTSDIWQLGTNRCVVIGSS